MTKPTKFRMRLITWATLLLVCLFGLVLGNFAFTHRFVIRHSRLPTATQYFGTEGYEVIGDFANLPSYAEIQVDGATNYVWEQSTNDVRALQKATDPTNIDRIAACWYNDYNMDIGVNLTDGKQHQIALYFLDWYNSNRVETVEVHDWTDGKLLDQRTIQNFGNGVYAIYNVSGHVYFHISKVSGPNVVISGIFFQPVGIPPMPSPTSSPTLTPIPTPTATPTATPTPSPTPQPTATPLPFCASGERPGNPPHCRCKNGFAGNSGKCR